jgi:hypothetical protein
VYRFLHRKAVYLFDFFKKGNVFLFPYTLYYNECAKTRMSIINSKSTFKGVPAVFEETPAKFEGAPAKFEGTPAKFEGAPTKFEGAPTKSEGAPAKSKGVPAKIEGILSSILLSKLNLNFMYN